MKNKMKKPMYLRRLLSIVLVLSLMFTSIPSTFYMPVYADEYVQKGRFLVVYEKGADETEKLSFRTLFSIKKDNDNEYDDIKNGEIISKGNENIALVNDSRMGISSTFRKNKIVVIEEDKMVSLLDDNAPSTENNSGQDSEDTQNTENENIENNAENNTDENTSDNENEQTNHSA